MNTLMRWSPLFTTRESGLRDFDRLFDSLVTGTSNGSGATFAPAADIHGNAEGFVIRLDLPGVPQKDVKVTVMDDTLTIRGERKLEATGEKVNVHHRERRYGTFERRFTLTAPVRTDQIRASYQDGVLEVSVPKAEEAKPREIEIQIR